MLHRLACAAGFALVLACTAIPADVAPVECWSLTFEYREGYVADPIWWSVTIGSEGLCCAQWRRWRGVHSGEPFDPTSSMRMRLHDAVERACLRDMPETLAASSDADSMTLTLTDGTGVHRVMVMNAASLARQSEPVDVWQRDAIRRFLGVVAEVLRLQPSPIGWQTPEALEALARGN